MKRASLYKYNKGVAWFFICAGAFEAIAGIIWFGMAINKGFDNKFVGGDWFSVIYLIQGILFLSGGLWMNWYKRFFVEWDSESLRFRTIESKKIISVDLSDIKAIDIRVYQILLSAGDDILTINLENSPYKDLKYLKEQFSILRESLGLENNDKEDY